MAPTPSSVASTAVSERYRVDALAVLTETSVDTIRYYQKQGVLHHPEREGRIGWYDQSHVDRLTEIKRLAGSGFTLSQIADLQSTSADPLLAALQNQHDSSKRVTRDELIALSGLAAGPVDLAISVGLLGAPDATDFDASAVEMLSSAAALLDAGLPIPELAKLAVRHAQHVEQLVDDAIELFASSTAPDRDLAADEVQRIVPQVSALVAKHFETTLVNRALKRAGGES